jgi:hypothetical protein
VRERESIRDAGEKAASVRALHRTSVPVIAGGTRRSAIPLSPILAGLLATGSVWSAETFGDNVRGALSALSTSATNDEHLDLGCSLQHGAFEQLLKPRLSEPRLTLSEPRLTLSEPRPSLSEPRPSLFEPRLSRSGMLNADTG